MDDSASAKKLTQQQIDSTMQRLWLNYYNDTLFERGIISEAERNRMRILIRNRLAVSGR